jgi:23S rRNA pseudouridine2605 synthase
MPTMRVNRALAQAGVASRRGAEELVKAGRVTLNGEPVDSLGAQVDPVRDDLRLDGKRLKLAVPVFYLYHKPRGLLSTMQDDQGRPCVGDLARDLPGHPKPVGRLDRASEGLMLLTSDGDAALRLTHPRYRVQKEYQVTVSPRLTDAAARQMVAGVPLEDGPARFTGIELVEQAEDRSRLRVVVEEGRNRLIRRVCEALDYRVLRLKRVRLGILALGKLAPGETRQLSGLEIENLRASLGLEKPKPPPQARPGKPPSVGKPPSPRKPGPR